MDRSKTRLIILVGIPGSGKSTWIKNNKDKYLGKTKVISRDEIRFALVAEDEDYFSKEKEVYKEFIRQIKEGINEHYDTIFVDATHFNRGSRTKLLRSLGSSLKGVEVNAVVIRPSLEITLAQNAQRTGRKFVPENIIKDYYNKFEIPSEEEGFDEIWIYEGDINIL